MANNSTHIMRKTKNILLAITAILFIYTAGAQAQPAQGNALPCGIWQLVISAGTGNETSGDFAPVWKIYSPDGGFTVMTWKSNKRSACIATSGRYKAEGDSVIVEDVEFSAYEIVKSGAKNRIRTNYIDKSCMLTQHSIENGNSKWEEVWKLITPEESPSQFSIPINGGKGENASRDVNGIYFYTENMPVFKDSDKRTLEKYIQSQISYPAKALKNGMEGISIIRFVVKEDGTTENFQVVRSSYDILDAEAIKVLEKVRFVPGTHDGKNVKVYLTVPVSFVLK